MRYEFPEAPLNGHTPQESELSVDVIFLTFFGLFVLQPLLLKRLL